MRYLYLDNFRGFSDSLIPLKDVNFLVGENSTGKTSALSILKILSDGEFLKEGKFNTSDIELGNFADLISGDRNGAKFTVGYISVDAVLSFLVSYKEVDNIPQIESVTYFVGKSRYYSDKEINARIVTARILPKKIQYSVTQIDVFSVESLIKLHKNNIKDSIEEIKTKTEMGDSPIQRIFDVERKLYEKKKSKTFYLPLLLAFDNRIIWVAPIRAEPKRTYDNIARGYEANGSHIPIVLNKILNDKKHELHNKVKEALQKFGKNSGLFKDIAARRYDSSDISSPFELNITLSNKPLKISNVGYGVSQVLPVIVETVMHGKKSEFAVQQPEVHLHPKAQAALGEFFFDLANLENKTFLIETHSDFLIDRFRLKIKESSDKKVKSQVLFFDKDPKTGGNRCTPIEIENNGKYSDQQPDNFQQFFINELSTMLEI